MQGEIGQAIHEASRAMEKLILSFERHIENLEASGANEEKLQRLTKGIHAVRDSAGIYMSWAKHYAKVVGEEGGEVLEDLEDFLGEGGDVTENPFGRS